MISCMDFCGTECWDLIGQHCHLFSVFESEQATGLQRKVPSLVLGITLSAEMDGDDVAVNLTSNSAGKTSSREARDFRHELHWSLE